MTWTVEQITARGGSRIYRATWGGETDTIAAGRLVHPGEVIDLWSVTTTLGLLAKFDIERWKQRMVAVGIASDDSLRRLALTGDKDTIQSAADQALELGKQAANTGTAYHKVAEQLSTAADAFNIAAELRPWAERFGRLLDDHGIIVKQREITVLNFTEGYAGQVDLFLLHHDRKRIGDTKTGSAGFRDQALQLAAYANAEVAYVDGNLVPLPDDIDKETGLILHVPAEGEDADLLSMPLADAWEAFKGCAAIKHAFDRLPKYVAERVEPSRRFADDYIDWIRGRLAELRQTHPAVVTMFMAWRTMTFGDRTSDQLSTDELEACLTALCDLEAREQVPFPSQTYPHPNGPRISTETAERIVARIDALPQWCQVTVLEQKAKLPAVEQWRTTDAEEFEQVLGPAESAAASLFSSICELRAHAKFPICEVMPIGTPTDYAQWNWTDFDIAGRLVEAIEDGLIKVDEDVDPEGVARYSLNVAATIVDRLVDKHGSKSDVTKVMRQKVADLGLNVSVPRSLAECVQDVVLVALAA